MALRSYLVRATAIAGAIAAMLPLGVVAHARQDSPLIPMRRALGGDRALAAVKSFTLTGTIARNNGPQTSTIDLEVDAVLPGQFVEITKEWRVVSPRVPSYRVTTYDGINGSHPIRLTVAPDAPTVHMPAPPPPSGATMPSMNGSHLAIAWLLPRFGALPDAYHMEILDDSQDGVVRLEGVDHYGVTLEIDPATHLPAALRWLAPPVIVISSASRGPVDISPVEWTTTFSDFRTEEGVLWPHRLQTSFNHAVYDDCKITKTKFNQPIDPRVFQPAK